MVEIIFSINRLLILPVKILAGSLEKQKIRIMIGFEIPIQIKIEIGYSI